MDSEEFSKVRFGDMSVTAKRSATPEGYQENVKKTVTFEIVKSLPNLEYEHAIRTAVISVLLELSLSVMNKDRLSDAESEVFQTICNVYGIG